MERIHPYKKFGQIYKCFIHCLFKNRYFTFVSITCDRTKYVINIFQFYIYRAPWTRELPNIHTLNVTPRVMNSHAAAINLQSSGQSVVGSGHHRGFSQPSATTVTSSSTTSNSSISSTADPWFLQSSAASSATSISSSVHPNPMPPTAPLRQHKRPAPQPNGMVLHHQQQQQQQPHSLNSLSNSQLHLLQQHQQQMSFAPPPPLQSQKPIPVQHHPHPSLTVIGIKLIINLNLFFF